MGGPILTPVGSKVLRVIAADKILADFARILSLLDMGGGTPPHYARGPVRPIMGRIPPNPPISARSPERPRMGGRPPQTPLSTPGSRVRPIMGGTPPNTPKHPETHKNTQKHTQKHPKTPQNTPKHFVLEWFWGCFGVVLGWFWGGFGGPYKDPPRGGGFFLPPAGFSFFFWLAPQALSSLEDPSQ